MDSTLFSTICLYMIVYYGIVLYTMYKFFKNACRCKKMEGYKKTWNYYFIVVYSILAFSAGIYMMITTIEKKGSVCRSITKIVLLLLLQLPAYFNDYALLTLFKRMRSDGCPCSVEFRNAVENMTYIRIFLTLVVIYKRCENIRSIKKVRGRILIRQ